MTDDNQPKEIRIEDLWSAVQRGEADGATVVIDDAVRIENYGSSLAKGFASIWGLGHLVGPHLVIDTDYEEPSVAESIAQIWEAVGDDLRAVLPPSDELDGQGRNDPLRRLRTRDQSISARRLVSAR